MATDVQVSSDGGSSWTSIDFQEDWKIEVPLSDVGLAPTATVTTQARENISPGDRLRIRIDGSTVFEGETASGG